MTPTIAHSNRLQKLNPHERDARIKFHPGPHVYTVDNHTSPETSEYVSVTTWVHSHFEAFDSDAVIDKMMASPYWPRAERYKKYIGKTKDEIKAEWETNRDVAAQEGTRMHAAIEAYYNDGMDAVDMLYESSRELAYFKNFDVTFRRSLKPYRTEWTVFHEELKLSGTIDMLFENVNPVTGKSSGTFSIYDWKRCKEIVQNDAFNKWALTPGMETIPDTNYWHYSLQLNLYKLILTEKYGIRVTGMYIICLHPNNPNCDYLRIEINDMQPLLRKILKLS
jgi:hypothetical protein